MAFFDKLAKQVTEASKSIDTKKIQENLTKTVNDTASKLNETVKNVDVKQVAKTITDTTTNVIETVKNTDPKDIPANIADMTKNASEAYAKHEKERKETKEAAKAVLKQEAATVPCLTIQDALLIIYLLMMIDHEYSEKEESIFQSAGKEIDAEFDAHREELIKECNEIVTKAEEGSYTENIKKAVAAAVAKSFMEKDTAVSGRLMVWNMIVAAYADDICSNEEYDLIAFVAEKMKVDASVMLEMTYTIKSMIAVEREEEWLKKSNRSYAEVDPQMKELAARKANMMQSIQALLKD